MFLLGFIPAKADSVVVLLCRSVYNQGTTKAADFHRLGGSSFSEYMKARQFGKENYVSNLSEVTWGFSSGIP